MSETSSSTATTATEIPEKAPAATPAAGAPSFRAQIDRWLLGLAQATTQGGAVAVKAFFGAAGASALGLGVQALDLKQMGAVFLAGAIYHFFNYLDLNPLPTAAAVTSTK